MNSTPLTRQLLWVATQSHSNLHPLQMRSSVPESSQDMGNFLLMEGRGQPLFYTYIVILVKEASVLLPGLCKEIRSLQSIAHRGLSTQAEQPTEPKGITTMCSTHSVPCPPVHPLPLHWQQEVLQWQISCIVFLPLWKHLRVMSKMLVF